MNQMNMWETLMETYKLPEKVRVFEAFSGIGCQLMGFNRAGIKYQSVGISEIDKDAILSYAAIHNNLKEELQTFKEEHRHMSDSLKKEMVDYLQERDVGFCFKTMKHSITMKKKYGEIMTHYLANKLTQNYGNISKIKGEFMPQIDLVSWSFPCTDLSKAGKKSGLSGGTRSGLAFEFLRIMQECKEHGNQPKVLVMENVIDLVQTKFIDQFNDEIQLPLEEMGYTNYVFTMNAKNYGVPQNRDRVFMVSILGKYYYELPKPIPLVKRLKDCLEENVPKKYYLSKAMLNYCMDMTDRNGLVRGERFNPHINGDSDYGFAITTNPGSRPFDNFILERPHLIVPEDTIKGFTEAYEGDGVYLDRPHQKRGVVQSQMIQTIKTTVANNVGVVVNAKEELCNKLLESGELKEFDMIRHSYTNDRMENDTARVENSDGVSACMTTRPDTFGIVVSEEVNNLRIRKLTPKEVWRVMDIDDSDFMKASEFCSNAQLFKQAGNGIAISVFANILLMMK